MMKRENKELNQALQLLKKYGYEPQLKEADHNAVIILTDTRALVNTKYTDEAIIKSVAQVMRIVLFYIFTDLKKPGCFTNCISNTEKIDIAKANSIINLLL